MLGGASVLGWGEEGWMSVKRYLEATRKVYMGTEYMTQAQRTILFK